MLVYGRSDATLNPGGVRIGTAEIYRVVERIDEVEEAVAVGQLWPPEQPTDTRVVLFVKLRDGQRLEDHLEERIRFEIRRHASPRHVPARIVQVGDIPRTKNGKVVELAVKAVVHGMPVTNTDALANPEALELFRTCRSSRASRLSQNLADVSALVEVGDELAQIRAQRVAR
jgi:acetoacetyl-CoA synthetase